ncbi:MAG: HlyD family efflux transporter periplasmic adaptor subunit [Planctomycetes bacterium]|nr:HlyD family efflux transporter periplasmic adaptor subunit [Planctomycetota bacterium]
MKEPKDNNTQESSPKGMMSSFASKHLERSILLEESGSPLLTKLVVLIILIVFCLFVVWSMIMEVDEVVSATGVVMPYENVMSIQHLEGGRVDKVFVKEGAKVEVGQILLTLNVVDMQSQLDELEVQELAAQERRVRIESYLNDKSKSGAFLAPRSMDGVQAHQLSYLEQSTLTLRAKRNVAKHKMAQLNEEIAEHHLQVTNLSQQRVLLSQEYNRLLKGGLTSANLLILEKEALQEEMDIREELVDQGLNSNLKFLSLQRQFYQIEKDIVEKKEDYHDKKYAFEKQLKDLDSRVSSLPHEVAKKQEIISELKEQLQEEESSLREKALQELDKLLEQEALLTERKKNLKDRLDHAVLKSPVAGRVHDLGEFGEASVVFPGQVLMQVIPVDSKLVAEIRILNADVGHVHEGQGVRLKIATFDFSRYGSLPGFLRSISPSTVINDDGLATYIGKVEISSLSPGGNRAPLPLMPGMTLDADIISGKKTVMEYLLKPIYASAQEILQER